MGGLGKVEAPTQREDLTKIRLMLIKQWIEHQSKTLLNGWLMNFSFLSA
ncbi:hypothetical protein KUC_1497 [Vreelandella boliviensis LC1]|uniref:Uncharacterized protein n=1 Tax=Vreelandella boliviensis LC1 TaxID=1072583 RepID=A0A7U9C3K1_9GAMM|nr:hypothetical protein KUC_1497 [Halomonas boliviensis LC1]